MKPSLLILLCLFSPFVSGQLLAEDAAQPAMIIRGEAGTQRAPHRRGNVYAPEIMRSAAGWRMWFGGQGQDGHDRIHLAESADGLQWQQRGVVLEDSSANHCNDPSVVEANGVLFMYYTRAGTGVADEIAIATSTDGVRWEQRGTALAPGKPGSWDSFAVGRPSVLFENGLFRMWYDGRKDLPPNAPDPSAPKSNSSQRHVGYATSTDGLQWRRHSDQPVYNHDAGGVHVLRLQDHLILLSESRAGTDCAVSVDGISWRPLGQLMARSDTADERYGHVTPFLVPDRDLSGATLYYGAAAAATWDANAICARRLSPAQWLKIKQPE